MKDLKSETDANWELVEPSPLASWQDPSTCSRQPLGQNKRFERLYWVIVAVSLVAVTLMSL